LPELMVQVGAVKQLSGSNNKRHDRRASAPFRPPRGRGWP
jgi:hypothetical protein